MEQNPTTNELDLIQVIDETDDLVQILGETPDEDNEEIEVTSVEFDGGESFFIDVDDEPFLSEEDYIENTFDSIDSADGADVI